MRLPYLTMRLRGSCARSWVGYCGAIILDLNDQVFSKGVRWLFSQTSLEPTEFRASTVASSRTKIFRP